MIRGSWQAAEREPEREALVDADGTRIRAGDLAAASNRLVDGLRANGVGPGDVIAILQPNGRPLLEALLGAMQAGLHCTAINAHLTPDEVPAS